MTNQPKSPQLSVFITGTDTGVGKSLFSAALLRALAPHHRRVVGMKPIAAGTTLINGVLANDDVLALRAASSISVPAELDNPVLLHDPVSPHIAAQRAGVTIDIAHITDCHRQLMARADAVVVEGAGGFMVPVSDKHTGADLARALGLPVVLVVGLRLGCLNHALLTAHAIRAQGLTLAGWVANHIDPTMLAQQDNIAFLQQQLAVPLLATIPFMPIAQAHQVTVNLPAAWTPV
jgi:dethiobiotin synthetase